MESSIDERANIEILHFYINLLTMVLENYFTIHPSEHNILGNIEYYTQPVLKYVMKKKKRALNAQNETK